MLGEGECTPTFPFLQVSIFRDFYKMLFFPYFIVFSQLQSKLPYIQLKGTGPFP